MEKLAMLSHVAKGASVGRTIDGDGGLCPRPRVMAGTT